MLFKNDIVNGLPKLKFIKDQLCSSCEVGKAKLSSFKTLTVTRSNKRLDLLHMDLCGPMRIETINGKKYNLVIVDDYSMYTWTLFLRSKDETPEVLEDFLRMIQRLAPQRQMTSDHNRSEIGIHDHNNEPSSSKPVPNVSPLADTTTSSLQELDLLLSPLYEEYFTAGNPSVSKSFALSDNSLQHDTQPTLNVQPTTEPIILLTNVHAEENNNDQAENA
nr:Gag-Pol polyprotein [Tanacetum cinerariifolium]